VGRIRRRLGFAKRPVSPDGSDDVELLGRPTVAPDPALMAREVTGKVVMITGAGGSIGSELCRQVMTLTPKAIILFEQSEFALYRIHKELLNAGAGAALLVPVLGSVSDPRLVQQTLSKFGVQSIYHAAAYKHVPMLETNIAVGIENNVFGTQILANAAIKAGVGSFTLISSDKAVRPASVMGASKRLAELVCQSLAASPADTRFAIVRFGNVLGSSGSVLPLFREQIRRGGPVTVATPTVARYFMTATEAAQLVLQASGLASGGEVFSLKMGRPIAIVDLAKRLILQTGHVPWVRANATTPRPHGTVEIVFSRLRCGEKDHEDLLLSQGHLPTSHPNIHFSWEPCVGPVELDRQLRALRHAIVSGDDTAIKRVLRNAPIAYSASGELSDAVASDAISALQAAGLRRAG